MIRLATFNDLSALFAVHQHSVNALCARDYPHEGIANWFEGRSEDMYRDAIVREDLWCADDRGLLGFVEIEGNEISKLFVAGDASGCGIGSALMNYALSELLLRGLHEVHVESTLTAAPFYRRFGFLDVGTGYFTRGYGQTRLEIIKMTLRLEGRAFTTSQ